MKRLFFRYPGFKPKALTLSYDDGVEQDIRMIEILNKAGIKCTFNLSSNRFYDEPQQFKPGRVHRVLTKDAAIKTYKNSGHEVAVHTSDHLFPAQLYSPLMNTAQIFEDRKELERMFGVEIRGMAYPYGQFTDEMINIAENCGIVYSRTTHSTNSFSIPNDWMRLNPTCHHNSPRLKELTEKFISETVTERAILFYLWGHTFEFETNDNWNVIEEFCEQIKNKDDIWYATNIEIYDYIAAFRALRYTADGNSIYNPTCTPVYIYVKDTKEQLIVEPGQWVNI